VANGNSWAGGININTKSATNIITGVKITNTILWNNAGDDAIRGSESPESVGCSVLNDSRYVGNDGNFYASPEFVDPAGGDYHLSESSPCIDRGDNSAVAGIDTDIDHDPRVVDGDKSGTAIVDIGCDEYVPEMPVVGDINDDGRVDLADSILALQVLVEKAPVSMRPGVDVNRDEKIGLEEIIYVLQVLAGFRYETRHSVSACKEPGNPNYDTDSERFAAEVVDCKLIVRHIDAVYNCCIEDIAVSVTVSDQVIDLYETEILYAPCDCLCPYDITTEIFDLPPGVYTVQVRSEKGLLGTIKEVVVPECPVCRDNTDCSEGFYCSRKEGDCDGVGRCSPKPQACITLWDPVCGCDGRTYGNACDAAASGTSVAHRSP
jgi:hypothetical protein